LQIQIDRSLFFHGFAHTALIILLPPARSSMSDSIYPSLFAPLVRWLRLLTLITDWSQLIGTRSLAAFPQRK
jgi:hypothetical protein